MIKRQLRTANCEARARPRRAAHIWRARVAAPPHQGPHKPRAKRETDSRRYAGACAFCILCLRRKLSPNARASSIDACGSLQNTPKSTLSSKP
jgi:hypothetical protein